MALSPKHERFCVEYVGNGCRGDLAYNAAYNSKTMKIAMASAPRVLARDDVKARIAELQEAVAKRNEMSSDRIMADLETVYQLSILEPKTYSAAVNAKQVQAKLGGHLIDKVQHSVENMSDAELTKAIQAEQGNTVIPWAKVIKASKG